MADMTPAPTDSQSETRLQGLDTQVMPAEQLAPLNQNIASAEADRSSAAAYGDSEISDARDDMRGALGGAQKAQNAYAAQGGAPNDHIDSLISASPWLIALSVFGGARSKLSANNLMAAQIGMVDGLNKGDEQGYQTALKKWNDEHQKLGDLMDQKWAVYKEMAKAYKGTIDSKNKALAVAEQAVRDARSDKQHQMMAWNQQVRAGIALKAVDKRFQTAEDDRASREKIAAEKEAGVAARAAEKAAATGKTGVKQTDDVLDLIDKAKGLVSRPHTLSRTGVGGMASRAIETVGNATGMTNDTSSHDLQSTIAELQLKLAPIMAKGSRTAKDQREKIEQIVRGMKPGDTDQNTISALDSLAAEVRKTSGTAEKTVVAKSKDGKFVKYSDGTTGPAPTTH